MKGLIVYCLDRIIRRGCRSCLHWYLSVLSRLIDTLDCYISKPKNFRRRLSFKVLFFFPLRLVIKKFGRASWQFSLRKREVLSRSSRGLFKVVRQVSQNMNDTEIADTDDESPSSASLWDLGPEWCKMKLQSKDLCVNTVRLFLNTFIS